MHEQFLDEQLNGTFPSARCVYLRHQRILRRHYTSYSPLAVVSATVAFGMGINKADVGAILHWGPPKTVR